MRKRFALAGLAALGWVVAQRIPAADPSTEGSSSSIAECAARCRATGATGWELVEHAQQLVWQQYRWHSQLHVWAGIEGSFSRRQGSPAQINTALARVLRELGFRARVVHAARVRRSRSVPWWRTGHVWLRVSHDGVTRDVCATRSDHQPGRVSFDAVTRVLPMRPVTYWATFGAIGLVTTAQLLISAARGEPTPAWVYHPHDRCTR